MTNDGRSEAEVSGEPSDAAHWVVRLADPGVGEADWLAFADWLSGDDVEARREAFDAAQALWLSIDAHQADLAAAVSAPQGPPPPTTTPRRAVPWRRVRLGVGAAAAAVAASVGVALIATGVVWRPPPTPTPAARVQVYATGIGQTRTLRLPDGTTIALNSASRIQVSYSAAERRVTMGQAEADFDVRHDPRRPFVVDVAGAEARVLGTAFDIAHYDGATRISVSRGRVRFQVAQQAVELDRGMAATRHDDTETIQSYRADPTAASAWRRGRLVYRDRPLGEVVADLNRHFQAPIRLTDAAAGRLRFTGVLVLNSQPKVVHDLTLLLPLDAHKVGESYVLDSRP